MVSEVYWQFPAKYGHFLQLLWTYPAGLFKALYANEGLIPCCPIHSECWQADRPRFFRSEHRQFVLESQEKKDIRWQDLYFFGRSIKNSLLRVKKKTSIRLSVIWPVYTTRAVMLWTKPNRVIPDYVRARILHQFSWILTAMKEYE